MNFFDVNNHMAVLGGTKTGTLALIGGLISYSYFMSGQKARAYNFFVNIHAGALRFLFGAALGTGLGYVKFGDR